MAKPQRKKRPTWFQKQIERGGVDFLNRKSAYDIQKEALSIIRDITRGNITEKDFEYLFDTKVLSNMKISIYAKYVELHVYDSSMNFVLQNQFGIQTLENVYGVTPENFQQTMNNNKDLMFAYGAVLNCLDSMISFVSSSQCNHTREMYLNVYYSVQAQLSRFRHII